MVHVLKVRAAARCGRTWHPSSAVALPLGAVPADAEALAAPPPVAPKKMLRVAARAASRAVASSGAGAAALSRRNMASSAGSSSVHSFSGTLLDGRPLELATLAGRPALIVNVASE